VRVFGEPGKCVDGVAAIFGSAERPSTQLKNFIVTESEAALNDLISGTPIQVTVAGRNSKGGESAPAAPVSATVP
jgi:hypothetical protein